MSETTSSNAPKWFREKLEKKDYSRPSGETWSSWAVVAGRVIVLGIAGCLITQTHLWIGIKILIGVDAVASFFFVLLRGMFKSLRESATHDSTCQFTRASRPLLNPLDDWIIAA